MTEPIKVASLTVLYKIEAQHNETYVCIVLFRINSQNYHEDYNLNNNNNNYK